MSIAERAISTTGQQIIIADEALDAFIANIRGQVIRPGDAGYDETRQLWNGMIDRQAYIPQRHPDRARPADDAGDNHCPLRLVAQHVADRLVAARCF